MNTGTSSLLSAESVQVRDIKPPPNLFEFSNDGLSQGDELMPGPPPPPHTIKWLEDVTSNHGLDIGKALPIQQEVGQNVQMLDTEGVTNVQLVVDGSLLDSENDHVTGSSQSPEEAEDCKTITTLTPVCLGDTLNGSFTMTQRSPSIQLKNNAYHLPNNDLYGIDSQSQLDGSTAMFLQQVSEPNIQEDLSMSESRPKSKRFAQRKSEIANKRLRHRKKFKEGPVASSFDNENSTTVTNLPLTVELPVRTSIVPLPSFSSLTASRTNQIPLQRSIESDLGFNNSVILLSNKVATVNQGSQRISVQLQPITKTDFHSESLDYATVSYKAHPDSNETDEHQILQKNIASNQVHTSSMINTASHQLANSSNRLVTDGSKQTASSTNKPPQLVQAKATSTKSKVHKGGWPKGKKRKTRVAVQKPIQQPHTIYMERQRKAVRLKFPKLERSEINRILGNMWKNLSKEEKEKYRREFIEACQKRQESADPADEISAMNDSSSDNVQKSNNSYRYCALCDASFFSKYNYSVHMQSKPHMRMIEKKLLKEIEKQSKESRARERERLEQHALLLKADKCLLSVSQLLNILIDSNSLEEAEVMKLRGKVQRLKEEQMQLEQRLRKKQSEVENACRLLGKKEEQQLALSAQYNTLQLLPELFSSQTPETHLFVVNDSSKSTVKTKQSDDFSQSTAEVTDTSLEPFLDPFVTKQLPVDTNPAGFHADEISNQLTIPDISSMKSIHSYAASDVELIVTSESILGTEATGSLPSVVADDITYGCTNSLDHDSAILTLQSELAAVESNSSSLLCPISKSLDAKT